MIQDILTIGQVFSITNPYEKHDWKPKIDAVIDKYKLTYNMPHKKKKRIRKELNSQYSLLLWCEQHEKEMFNFE